jgi:hypothetical protein
MVEVVVSGDADAVDSLGDYPAGTHPPLLMTARYGAGQVVALGHEAYISTDDNDADGIVNRDYRDNRKLGRNIIQFLAGYQ